MIRPPLRFGNKGKAKNVVVDFLVMDVPTAYNIILGRATLHKVKDVIAPYRLQLQFEADDGIVGTMQGDQRMARECYLVGLEVIILLEIRGQCHQDLTKETLNLLTALLVSQFLCLGRPLSPRRSLSLSLGLHKCGIGFGERLLSHRCLHLTTASSNCRRFDVAFIAQARPVNQFTKRVNKTDKPEREEKEYVPYTSATTTSSSVTLGGSEVPEATKSYDLARSRTNSSLAAESTAKKLIGCVRKPQCRPSGPRSADACAYPLRVDLRRPSRAAREGVPTGRGKTLSSSRQRSASAAICSEVASSLLKGVSFALVCSAQSKEESGQNLMKRPTKKGSLSTLRNIFKNEEGHSGPEEVVLEHRKPILRLPITILAPLLLRPLYRLCHLGHKLRDRPRAVVLPYIKIADHPLLLVGRLPKGIPDGFIFIPTKNVSPVQVSADKEEVILSMLHFGLLINGHHITWSVVKTIPP
ncbi:LOW QUALITY PROTEIN: hypothetical protein Cgig2_010237 [Carnegiea gigantea]|uniref:Uncharacterized protein n=1 Tax=Carnegiea gigantea TaxID=171969 RepID=A0A9Q1GJU1_9CARY|nr:LOW QUALITY PROTEIN: hypothetical protein Cgig2_010237 [Carnegiea gigantea]